MIEDCKTGGGCIQPKPFLRWAGSKQKLIPHLQQYWGTGHARYIEPFMGSAKLFFAISPEQAILSDANAFLVEVFNQVKKDPYPIFKILRSFKVSKTEYYKIRAIDPNTLGINQRVARFIYLNKLCFNGLYRTNLNGHFNVPFSGENSFDAAEEYEVLKKAAKKLTNVKIACSDFEKSVTNNVKPGDFVYLDPPYAVENRRIFRQYGPQTFGLDDLERLKYLLRYIDGKGAKFLLSYAYCREAIQIADEWLTEKRFTQRNIAGFSKYRRKAAEMLITNIEF